MTKFFQGATHHRTWSHGSSQQIQDGGGRHL